MVNHVGREGPVTDVDEDIDDCVADGIEKWELLGEASMVTSMDAGKERVDEGSRRLQAWIRRRVKGWPQEQRYQAKSFVMATGEKKRVAVT